MKINYQESGKDRKRLASIVSESISEELFYAGAPTYAFRIGDFTVTREGALEFDSAATDEAQIKAVIEALQAAGFNYEDSSSLAIGFPLDGFTDEVFANLEKLVASKAPLIKKALGVDSLPIERGETELTFDWFRAGLSREETYAFAQFITQLCKTAKDKKRVTAKPQESYENEKFTMRVWLIGLGLVGKDFALARKLLLQNLTGNGAWRYGKPESTASAPESEAATDAVTAPDAAHTALKPEVAGLCGFLKKPLWMRKKRGTRKAHASN
jgi:hypothetical protein